MLSARPPFFDSIIMDYFGNGMKFGVNIQYYFEEIPLGNAGALFKLRNQLTEPFLLLNADVVFDVDEITFIPKETVKLTGEDLDTFNKMLDMFDDVEDVKHVYHNVEL